MEGRLSRLQNDPSPGQSMAGNQGDRDYRGMSDSEMEYEKKMRRSLLHSRECAHDGRIEMVNRITEAWSKS